MAFIFWVPFDPPDKRLSLLEIKDPLKSTVIRKAEKSKNDANRENDGIQREDFLLTNVSKLKQ